MKSTKAAKAEKAEQKLRDMKDLMRGSLAWPEYPCPERQSSGQMDEALKSVPNGIAVRAWTYNAHSRRVSHGCYNHVHHNRDGDTTNSQCRGGPWFYTRIEALRAMRWAVCESMAEELFKIDSEIQHAK